MPGGVPAHLAGHLAGDNLDCFVYGPVAENWGNYGAKPSLSFWEQLRGGPQSWIMFFSCVGFLLPALVHLSFYLRACRRGSRRAATEDSEFSVQHQEKNPCGGFLFRHRDLWAGMALCCVSLTSPLCDAFLVRSAELDVRGTKMGDEFPFLQKLVLNLEAGTLFGNALKLGGADYSVAKMVEDVKYGKAGRNDDDFVCGVDSICERLRCRCK